MSSGSYNYNEQPHTVVIPIGAIIGVQLSRVPCRAAAAMVSSQLARLQALRWVPSC